MEVGKRNCKGEKEGTMARIKEGRRKGNKERWKEGKKIKNKASRESCD